MVCIRKLTLLTLLCIPYDDLSAKTAKREEHGILCIRYHLQNLTRCDGQITILSCKTDCHVSDII